MSLDEIYLDICNGYSVVNGVKFNHLSFIDKAKLSSKYNEILSWAIESGMRNESDIINDLHRNGKWSISKANHIKSIENKIKSLENSKPKIKTEAQIDSIYENLQILRKELSECLEEKFSFLLESAESFANARLRFYSVQLSTGITEEELDYNEKYKTIDRVFSLKMSNFSRETIKQICIEPFFYNIYLLQNSPVDFFGKPLIQLSTFQNEMLLLGKTYAKIISELNNIPEKYEKCPERLLMYWYYVQNDGEKEDQKKDDAARDFLNFHAELMKNV